MNRESERERDRQTETETEMEKVHGQLPIHSLSTICKVLRKFFNGIRHSWKERERETERQRVDCNVDKWIFNKSK